MRRSARRTSRACRLVPGVEISASWRSQAIHVLGLWIDPASPELRGVLRAQGELRRLRMRKICARLEKLGLPGAELLAAVESNPGLPTRAHLAEALVAGGHVDTARCGIPQILGQGQSRAHSPRNGPRSRSVVGWIRAAGGVASLAHPARYALSAGARRHLLADFAAAGGTALEVVTRRQRRAACRYLRGARREVRSIRIGGLGLSQPATAWNPLGRSLKLPDCVTPVWRSFGL